MSSNRYVLLNDQSVNEAKLSNKCDICGKVNIKVHRRYKNEAYCVNCYSQCFIKAPCKVCGEIHRFHFDNTKPVCTNCMRKQSCIRCGKDAFKNGTNTEYGRVCQTCNQNYFKPKKLCFECGEAKAHVSRYTNISHDQAICRSCYQRHVHETCPCCHRYRKLVDTDNGRMCQKCHEQGQIACPSCQKLMWAGLGNRCWDCYWSSKIDHEVELNQFTFKSITVKDQYANFIDWFSRNKGLVKANLKHNNFIEFFAKCDELWGYIPDYKTLVMEFKPEGLRHNLTVLRWLTDTKQVAIDNDLKQQISESERIANLLNKLGENTPAVIEQYYAYLIERQNRKGTALKSVRLCLQPAVDIYQQFNIQGAHTPSQEQITTYLTRKSGQANNLSAFIVFLRERYQVELNGKPPQESELINIKKKEAEKGLMDLMKKPKPLSQQDQLKWLKLGMIYFHGVNSNLKESLISSLKKDENNKMYILVYNQQQYFIPIS